MDKPSAAQIPEDMLPPVRLDFYLDSGIAPEEFGESFKRLQSELSIDDLILLEDKVRTIDSLNQAILPYLTSCGSCRKMGIELEYQTRTVPNLNKEPSAVVEWSAQAPLPVPDYLKDIGVSEIIIGRNYLTD